MTIGGVISWAFAISATTFESFIRSFNNNLLNPSNNLSGLLIVCHMRTAVLEISREMQLELKKLIK